MKNLLNLLLALIASLNSFGQRTVPACEIDINYNDNFSGFDLINLTDSQVFIIAEDFHNRRLAPAMTLKFIQFLYQREKIRTIAIEGGISTAFLLNSYLESGDTTLLRDIARHTFFWSKEHFVYYQALAAWNNTLPSDQRIVFESADIEIKQESVILALNMILSNRSIPVTISKLESFKTIFKEKESHRKQYLGLNVQYYYDKKRCSTLVDEVLADFKLNEGAYKTFFNEKYNFFKTMMTDLKAQYIFDYHTNSKFMYRDNIMFDKLVAIAKRHPEGFLQVVGAKHTRPGSSSFRLKHEDGSPAKDHVLIMNLTGRKTNGKYLGAKAVTRFAAQYSDLFKPGKNMIIENDGSNELLDNSNFDYTLALMDNDHVSPFSNSYWGK
jgi:hypothetical protein